MSVEVSSATAADLPSITRLHRSLLWGGQNTPPNGFLVVPIPDQDFLHYIERRELIVARVNGTIGGYAIVQDFYDPEGDLQIGHYREMEEATMDLFKVPRLLFLHQIAVGLDFRKKGIGRALYAEIASRFPDHAITCFIVEKPDPNLASKLAHEKIGFRRIGVVRLARFFQFENHESGVYFRPPAKP